MLTRRAAAVALLTGFVLGAVGPVAAQTELRMISFSGATNLPGWVAEEKGFFAKEGLKVSLAVTQGSVEQVKDTLAGKYEIMSTAFDNIVAYAEDQGDYKLPQPSDFVAIAGVHSGLNRLVVRPEIKTYADIKGKAVAVDAVKSGYATVLYQILENNGLVFEKDYTPLPVGGTSQRLNALKGNKAVAAILSSPADMEAQKEGFTFLADASEAVGSYQGSAYVVRRGWAKDHDKEVLAFIRAIAAATDYVFENKSGAIEVMKKRIKGASDEELAKLYDRIIGPGGLNPRAALNMNGVQTVLKIRSQYGEPKREMGPPSKYVDLSFYERALGKK
ncbi:MAG TPA: ABC transporter substrate-binding protein [Beijerinckiaceae bacterium]|jgi:ABC-type nitrate/sulfonate/bicarbonate transport system substrate-binding protein